MKRDFVRQLRGAGWQRPLQGHHFHAKMCSFAADEHFYVLPGRFCTLLGKSNRLLQNPGLALHLVCLALDGAQIPPEQEDLKSTDGGQEKGEEPVSAVAPIFGDRQGRKVAHLNGLGGLATSVPAGILALAGAIERRRGALSNQGFAAIGACPPVLSSVRCTYLLNGTARLNGIAWGGSRFPGGCRADLQGERQHGKCQKFHSRQIVKQEGRNEQSFKSSVRYTEENSVRLCHRSSGSIHGGIIVLWGIPRSEERR